MEQKALSNIEASEKLSTSNFRVYAVHMSQHVIVGGCELEDRRIRMGFSTR
jgi:hypothetical protein